MCLFSVPAPPTRVHRVRRGFFVAILALGGWQMWEIDDQIAIVRLASFTAQVDLLRPHKGVHGVRIQREPIVGAEVLQARTGDRPSDQDDELVDTYVRGADLVAVYASTAQPSIRAQIYWRAIWHDALEAAGVEIIASVHTSSLDSDPRMTIGSNLPDCEVWRLLDESESRFERVAAANAKPLLLDSQACLVLFRLSGAACSYVEMIHAADFTAAEIRASASGKERVRSKFRLFDEPLEKGVIRRGLACGMFVAREGDKEAAVECYRRFVQSAIPLTT
jgi:hypothetical protein